VSEKEAEKDFGDFLHEGARKARAASETRRFLVEVARGEFEDFSETLLS
jgi:hypothetical protein